jgi:type II secretory pathway predicted ATPase ExeA
MDYQHFSLTGSPFQAASPSGALFLSPTHVKGLATLEWGLSEELNGFTLLTGEAGTGKTTLIYSLLQRDFKQVRIAYIVDPKLSFLELLRVILDQLNLYSKGSTKLDYLEALDRFLKLRRKEERVAVIIDESQDLSDDGLEELRLLSNHGQQNDRCLQLILVGQPELAERLKKPELRQLNQRISTRGELSPLDPEQAMKYVECRLRAQGGECTDVFERRALERLLQHSDGIPRQINVICHNAMLLAYSKGAKKVDLKTAIIAAREYDDSFLTTGQISSAPHLQGRPALIGGAIVSAALTSALLGFVYLHVPSDQTVKQTVSSDQAIEQTVRPDQGVKQLGMVGYADPAAIPPAAAPLASHPVEHQTSLAPGAAVLKTPKGAVTGPAKAPEMRAVPAPPAAVAVNAATQEQTRVPASLERRRQITVRYGDTLENLAIHYFRSRSGINALIDANPQLTNINRLSIGQIIYLPSDSTPKASHDHHSLISSTELPSHVDAGGGDTSGPNTTPVENSSSSSDSGPSAVPDHNAANAGVGRNVSTVSAGNHAVDATANLSAAAAVVPDRPNLSLLKVAPKEKLAQVQKPKATDHDEPTSAAR